VKNIYKSLLDVLNKEKNKVDVEMTVIRKRTEKTAKHMVCNEHSMVKS